MSLAIIVGRNAEDQKNFPWFIQSFRQSFLKLQPDLSIEVYPDITNYEKVDFVTVWRHPAGIWNLFPHLKCVAALSAGVDHIILDADLPENIPIVRVMDPAMATDITQYVVAIVLSIIKKLDCWQSAQREKQWNKQPPFNLAHKTIGILGLGFLGSQAASALDYLGLKVIGWSNSLKNLNIKNFVGQEQLLSFLAQTDILICMLPLTTATRNILNKQLFSHLPQGAYLINVGRGEHLVEKDLLEALNSGHLSGACLDVFVEEPLPNKHPFWDHPQIKVTPHIASVTNPETAAQQIYDNYCRMLVNQPLLNRVDRLKGY